MIRAKRGIAAWIGNVHIAPDDESLIGPFTVKQLRLVTLHYCMGALWADEAEGTSPRISVAQFTEARKSCAKFILECHKFKLWEPTLARFEHGYGVHPDAGSAEAAFGHDFWLTRQGHGTGFWDRNELKIELPMTFGAPRELGDALTYLAQKFGEVHHYQHGGWFYFS